MAPFESTSGPRLMNVNTNVSRGSEADGLCLYRKRTAQSLFVSVQHFQGLLGLVGLICIQLWLLYSHQPKHAAPLRKLQQTPFQLDQTDLLITSHHQSINQSIKLILLIDLDHA